MRRVLLVFSTVLVFVLAGLLIAHDALWSVLLGIVVALGGCVAAVGRSTARLGALHGLVGGVAVTLGTAAAGSELWLQTVGREATVTVASVHQHDGGKGVGLVDEDTLRLDDGSEVAGPLRDVRLGRYHPGDRVDVRYDPVGLVRFPTLASDHHRDGDVLGGAIAVAVGLVLLAAARPRRPDDQRRPSSPSSSSSSSPSGGSPHRQRRDGSGAGAR
ncbi:hypothetical protein ACXR2U_12665 [Jatrophihabitans sp. YIM 134969]